MSGNARCRPLFLTAAPAALADDFPANEDPHCTYDVPKRFFRRYAGTKVRVLLGEKLDPERPYHTSVVGGKVVTLVR